MELINSIGDFGIYWDSYLICPRCKSYLKALKYGNTISYYTCSNINIKEAPFCQYWRLP